jgi:hypothetical protein
MWLSTKLHSVMSQSITNSSPAVIVELSSNLANLRFLAVCHKPCQTVSGARLQLTSSLAESRIRVLSTARDWLILALRLFSISGLLACNQSVPGSAGRGVELTMFTERHPDCRLVGQRAARATLHLRPAPPSLTGSGHYLADGGRRFLRNVADDLSH